MKKVLTRPSVFFLGVMVAVVVLWDVPESRTTADGRILVRYWMIVGFKEVIPGYAAEFSRIQDSIEVEVTPIPWQEHEKKILAAVASGDPPDVVNQITPIAKWASRMALLPLDDYIRRDGLDTSVFFPSLWEEMKWQGKTFGLPIFSGSFGLFYNRTLFMEAGLDPDRPPRTWDEVAVYADRLTKRDGDGRIAQIGFIPNYGNLHASVVMAWELGARFVSEDGTRVQLDDPAVVRAFRWVEEYYARNPQRDVAGFLGGLGLGDQHGFLNSRIAMMILDSSFPDQIRRYRPDMDFGVALIPTFEGFPTASASGSWWLAIPKGARNPEASWQFMRYAVETETQLREIERTEESLFPANRRAAYSPRFMNSPERTIFVRQMEHSHSPSIVPLAHDVFWRELFGAQERVVYGRQSPEQALLQAQKSVQAVLDVALDYDRYVRSRLEGG